MKTTVKYHDVKYFEETVNDVKVVRCVLSAEVQLNRVKYIEHMLEAHDVKAYLKKRTRLDNGNVLISASAIAKCNPSDEYNFEIGRRIAYTRAQEKAFVEASIIYDTIVSRMFTDIYNTTVNCLGSASACFSHAFHLAHPELDVLAQVNGEVDDTDVIE